MADTIIVPAAVSDQRLPIPLVTILVYYIIGRDAIYNSRQISTYGRQCLRFANFAQILCSNSVYLYDTMNKQNTNVSLILQGFI